MAYCRNLKTLSKLNCDVKILSAQIYHISKKIARKIPQYKIC